MMRLLLLGAAVITLPHESENVSTIKLLVEMPLPKVVTVEMDVNSTIRNLKEKLHKMEGVHPVRLILHANGIELNDARSIKDSGLSDNSTVRVTIRAIPIGPTKLSVVICYDNKRAAVEVDSSERVGELRNKLKNNKGLGLPHNYFFIYGQSVMSDDRTFKWHGVTEGTTIDVFRGRVSSSSSS